MSISPKCKFTPSAKFPQVLISSKCPFPPSVRFSKCQFSSNAHFPRVPIFLGTHLLQGLFCSKCPFPPELMCAKCTTSNRNGARYVTTTCNVCAEFSKNLKNQPITGLYLSRVRLKFENLSTTRVRSAVLVD